MSGRWVRWLLSLAHAPRRGGAPVLLVVRHHRVYGGGERPLYRLGVAERVLEAQLAWLTRAGRTPTTLSEGLDALTRGREGVHVAFTFDDGYDDNVERALPLLTRHGARATFFITAGLVEDRRAPWWDRAAAWFERVKLPHPGIPGLVAPMRDERARAAAFATFLGGMRLAPEAQEQRLARLERESGGGGDVACSLATWERLRRLVEGGMEVGAHTLTHPFLSLVPEARQRAEVADSRTLIESRLGVRVTAFAYPGGDYGPATPGLVREAGLACAVTTRAGANGVSTPRHELRRRGLSEGACLGPGGGFSARMAAAELDGAFDRMRGVKASA